jgi:hypothetical protein
MLAPVMAAVRFKLATGDDVYKSVDSEEDAQKLARDFVSGKSDSSNPWVEVEVEVDDGTYIARDAIVSVTAIADPSFGDV